MHSTNELSVIMATQFVKWWKTKFHAGGCSYKSISVLGSNVCDGRPSDTEELVRDDASSSYNNGAHINPGLASSTISATSHPDAPEYIHHHHSNEVKFEDFECDVQVEGCGSGEERKEFSFTFYDFDGHGKITKDDIAGLVRSIYGAVNDSITVPHGGKKTIKVKLTVTPEKTQQNSPETTSNNDATPTTPPNNNNNNNNTTNINNNLTVVGMGNGSSSNLDTRPKLRNNVNVTIKENLNRDRLGGGSGRKEKELRDKLSHHLDKPKFNSVRLPSSAHGACRGCRNLSPEVFRDCSASPLRNRKKWRERVCSLQRPDIFEILQANMEKNNVNPCCRREHTQPQHPPHVHLQHSMAPCTHSQLIGDSTCPVLPLLNENLCKQKQHLLMENTCPASGPRPLHHHHLGGSKIYDAHIHRSSHHHSHQHQCRKHGHHRSRSHDLSQNLFKHHLLSERDQLIAQGVPLPSGGVNQTCCNMNSNNVFLDPHLNQQHQPDPLEILEGCFVNQQHFSPRNKNTNLANAASTPHQLKHRNREQEHARAMAQVISWLERENIGDDKKFASPNRRNPNPSTNSLVGSPPVVKKHEHHHVHHHYHHHHFAKETPIIV
ncbi:unnamed protein product [Orchesella dallaii]|uniref:Protein naked cuticle homolog n=1 Tax=Orchesella dallaii TaxID=48710 RepID=A0ABP1QFU4_9HEXA